MEVIVLFFTDPDSWNSRPEFRGVFADRVAAEQWIERKYGKPLSRDAWAKAAYTFRTETVVEPD